MANKCDDCLCMSCWNNCVACESCKNCVDFNYFVDENSEYCDEFISYENEDD